MQAEAVSLTLAALPVSVGEVAQAERVTFGERFKHGSDNSRLAVKTSVRSENRHW